MTTFYHVAPKTFSGDLVSLYQCHGNDAYEIYAEKWPEASELGEYHVHYVHLHEKIEDARSYVGDLGGVIIAVDVDKAENDFFIEFERDRLEYDHPMVRDNIPAECLSVVA